MSGFVPKAGSAESSAPARLALLDGMRGIAALAVLMLHVPIIWQEPFSLPRAHLAVDFFFMLSGFVVARAYEAKLKTSMTFTRFVAVRLRRLYPMLLAGTLIGAMPFAVRVFILHSLDMHQFMTMLLSGLLLLPTTALGPVSVSYPLDSPEWSLFFEIAINFVYAAAVMWLTVRRLFAVCAISGAALSYAAMTNHGLNFGFWPHDLFYGFIRVTFSFSMGVLLYRYRPAWRLGPAAGMMLAALLVLILFSSIFAGNWIYEFLIVALVFPLVVLLGSRCESTPALGAICLGLGELSYPLYIVHYPVLQIIGRTAAHAEHIDLHIAPEILGVAAAALSVVLAILLLNLWDRPMRKWLAGLPAAMKRYKTGITVPVRTKVEEG